MEKLNVLTHGNKSTISDDEIESSFKKFDGKYGNRDHRKLLEQLCLSRACGSYSGYNLEQIAKDLKLITGERKLLTRKGKEFLQFAYLDTENKG